MAMLAERKRKTKWSNLGRQALWNRDSTDVRFGREVMERMGWKPGQGLGVCEQGIKVPLKISFKDDNKGLGFKENDNEWIQQQADFDVLLSKLSSDQSSDKVSEDSKNITQSLEEKSKLSKARVHYHKFTRGKDLSKYTKKDLECIFGRNDRELEMQSHVEDSICDSAARNKGLVTFNAGSMVDYFAKKIRNKINMAKSSLSDRNEEHEENLSNRLETDRNIDIKITELHEKKKKKSKRRKENTEEKDDESCDKTNSTNTGDTVEMKHDSKRHKKECLALIKVQSDPLPESKDCENIITENEFIEVPKEKRKKREYNLCESDVPGENLRKQKKKKKKKEDLVKELNEKNVQENKKEIVADDAEYKEREEEVNSLYSAEASKRKKKSKRNSAVITDKEVDAGDSEEKIRKKKKKKFSEAENFFNEQESVENENNLNSITDSEPSEKCKREEGKNIDRSVVEDKQSIKSDKNGPTDSEDPIIYKAEYLKKGNLLKSVAENKMLNLIYHTNIEKFNGSNLSRLKGYGIVHYN